MLTLKLITVITIYPSNGFTYKKGPTQSTWLSYGKYWFNAPRQVMS